MKIFFIFWFCASTFAQEFLPEPDFECRGYGKQLEDIKNLGYATPSLAPIKCSRAFVKPNKTIADLYAYAISLRKKSHSGIPKNLNISMVPDYRNLTSAGIIIVGDTGDKIGEKSQYFKPSSMEAVSAAIFNFCTTNKCDFGLVTGDLIYQNGMPKTNRRDQLKKMYDYWDRFFPRLERYSPSQKIDYWVTIGNHDLRGDVDFLIKHTNDFLDLSLFDAKSTRVKSTFNLPALDYEIPNLPPWLKIFSFDSNWLGLDHEEGFGPPGGKIKENVKGLAKLKESFCGRTNQGWKITMAHHPVYTLGSHGNKLGVEDPLKTTFEPILKECGVDLHIAGHDHLQQFDSIKLTDSKFAYNQLLIGSSSKLTHKRKNGYGEIPNTQIKNLFFSQENYGFAYIIATKESLDIRIYQVGGERGNFILKYHTKLTNAESTRL